MTTQESIYEMPRIKALAMAERLATNTHSKRVRHLLWLEAVKVEQIKRGQRSQMSYRRTAKKSA